MKSNKRLTKEQAAIVGLFTGITCGPFADIQKLADDLLGHPTFTHQFASQGFWDKLKELVKPQFIALCYEEDASHEPTTGSEQTMG